MLKKTSVSASPYTIMNDDARRAEAQKQINRHLIKWVAFKVGTTVVAAVAVKIIMNKLENAETSSSED